MHEGGLSPLVLPQPSTGQCPYPARLPRLPGSCRWTSVPLCQLTYASLPHGTRRTAPRAQVVKWGCPGHADPQPETCPGFAYPVPGTFT